MFWAMMAVFSVFFLIYFSIKQSRENKRQIEKQQRDAKLATEHLNAFRQWTNREISDEEYRAIDDKYWGRS
jgi:uncharacterized membrane protein